MLQKAFKWMLPAFLLLLLEAPLVGQSPDHQQHIEYEIKAELDDQEHLLRGELQMTYQNNSPDTLQKIYMHLWPNAFSHNGTARMKQRIERVGNWKSAFFDEWGKMDSLSFRVDGEEIPVHYQEDRTIALLELPVAIPPGDSAKLSTPFRTHFPSASFARMGHRGQAYRAAYWYPFPAVYDEDGWHPMTLLRYGEGYHEYGDYEVTLEIPENYRVAATGVLQNEAERQWLDSLARETAERDSFPGYSAAPPSSEAKKTLHYEAANVVDFAWFANKRFQVLKEKVDLPKSERKVTTWAFFPSEMGHYWKKAPAYMEQTLETYSRVLGDLPYPQVTTVFDRHGHDMEFPMMAQIKGFHPSNIVHELGHNWFYGAIHSDQRQHAWLDEGLNSYLEERVLYNKKDTGLPEQVPHPEPPPFLKKDSDGDWDLLPGLDRRLSQEERHRTGQLLQERLHLDQAPGILSSRYTSVPNYGINSYSRTSTQLHYLEAYIGKERLDRTLKEYFEKWKFQHPGPEDFFRLLRQNTDQPVGWFTEDYIEKGAEIDLAITDVEQGTEGKEGKAFDRIEVENRGESRAPFYIGAIKDQQVVDTIWYDGFEGDSIVHFPTGDYDSYRIDPFFLNWESDRKDNAYRFGEAFPTLEPLHFDPLMSFNRHDRTEVTFFPAVGWNNYDKTMLGVAFYNGPLFPRDFEYALIPMYGTSSGEITGLYRLAYNWYWDDSELVDRFRFEVNGKRFSEAFRRKRDGSGRDVFSYTRITPKLSLHFEPPSSEPALHNSLSFRSVNLLKDPGNDAPLGERLLRISGRDRRIDEYSYEIQGKHFDSRYHGRISFQNGQAFKKGQITLEYRDHYQLWSGAKRVDLRFYGGMNLGDENMPSDVRFRANAFSGREDYMYDHLYLDRGGNDAILGQRIAEEGAGFKALGPFAVSDQGIVSMNFESELPIILRYIKVFGDIATTPERIEEGNSSPVLYNAGLTLNPIPLRSEWLEDPLIEIHFPFFRSKGTGYPVDLSSEDYWERVTFTLRLHQADIMSVLRKKGVTLF